MNPRAEALRLSQTSLLKGRCSQDIEDGVLYFFIINWNDLEYPRAQLD